MSSLTCSVQQAFKVAVIKSLLKKNTLDLDVLAYYRPISNLPVISQNLGKTVSNQLGNYLDINGLLEDIQSGFRIHHTTEPALLKVTNYLLALDNGLLLDLSAAFDIIDHEILSQRLEQHVGIKRTALCWFN